MGFGSSLSLRAIEAQEASAARRAIALLVGLACAKLAAIVLRIVDGGGGALRTPFAPLAMLYQDVVLVAAFALLDALAARTFPAAPGRNAVAWGVAWVLVAYSALNVAVARVFSTPLTRSMWRAAGGALRDSIVAYVTLENVVAMALVVAAAALAARSRPRALPSRAWAALGLGLALFGPPAAARVETLGLHRNAAVALVSGFLERVPEGRVALPLPPEGGAHSLEDHAGRGRGRNVIWVILESTAAQYLGSYGGDPDPTPSLTRLGREAWVFEHAYTAYPESIKGLLSMLCSVPPAPHAVAADYTAARYPCSSLAEELRRAGYRTGLFHSGRFVYLGMQGIVDGRGFDELHDAATIGGRFASSFGTDDASTVQRLLAFVDAVPKNQPFFAVYSPISGHHPYNSPGQGPRPFPARTELDHYRNDLHAGDAAFGELVDGLRSRGLHERTLYVVVGDHGEAFGQHEGNFAHTLQLYEENVRVPFIVAAPGLIAGQTRLPQIASLVDMAPTTLALVGLTAPSDWTGASLLAPVPRVARFQTDHGPLQLGLRQGKYKAVYQLEHDRLRLFDLARDPQERRDIVREEPARALRYREHLLGFAAEERARLERSGR